MKFFLRITRFSDRGWKSYRLPEAHEWGSGEFETLQDMIDAGAYQTEGLAGIPWPKPYLEEDDVIFSADSPVFAGVEDAHDVTVGEAIANGFIVRVYAGEKIEDLPDGVIFHPVPLTEEEAWKLMNEWDISIYPENYERGLLDAMALRPYTQTEIWDR